MAAATKIKEKTDHKILNELIDQFIDGQTKDDGFLSTQGIRDVIVQGAEFERLLANQNAVRDFVIRTLDQMIRQKVKYQKGEDGHSLFASVGITTADGKTHQIYKEYNKTKPDEKNSLSLIGQGIA